MPEAEEERVTQDGGESSEKVGEESVVKEEKVHKPSRIEVEIPAPFPTRLTDSKKDREARDIMAMFRQVKINIPLLDAIAQVPRYARFLKELCTSKKKLKGTETVWVGENVSSLLQKRLPPKCKDPGVFTIPCTLGSFYAPRAMLDNGASINVLPYSIFKTLNMGDLKRTGVAIQLADKSIVHPKGVLEDVLVQVKGLVFPADFYVLDMGDDDNPNSCSILLGRPFLKTARTKMDCYDGTISMEFDGDVIHFNISEATNPPINMHALNFIDIIPHLTNTCHSVTNNEVQELDFYRNSEIRASEEVFVEREKKMVKEDEKMMVNEMVKKKRKRRKWKWIRIRFPCA